jgi:hypothetical protein
MPRKREETVSSSHKIARSAVITLRNEPTTLEHCGLPGNANALGRPGMSAEANTDLVNTSRHDGCQLTAI